MKRRLAREIALQALFQTEFSDIQADEAIQAVYDERNITEGNRNVDYVRELVLGVLVNKEKIDGQIAAHAKKWKLERMANVDRNILRIAVYELFYSPQKLTANIIINEAIEIGKVYSSDEGPKFINGVLGNMINEAE